MQDSAEICTVKNGHAPVSTRPCLHNLSWFSCGHGRVSCISTDSPVHSGNLSQCYFVEIADRRPVFLICIHTPKMAATDFHFDHISSKCTKQPSGILEEINLSGEVS